MGRPINAVRWREQSTGLRRREELPSCINTDRRSVLLISICCMFTEIIVIQTTRNTVLSFKAAPRWQRHDGMQRDCLRKNIIKGFRLDSPEGLYFKRLVFGQVNCSGQVDL